MNYQHFERYRDIIDDFNGFMNCLKREVKYSIRANTILANPEDVFSALEEKGFVLRKIPLQPHVPAAVIEDMPVKHPGATMEHFLGLYYVQELASMLPPIALSPKSGEVIVDMCAAPGSKTTEIAQMICNEGTVIAIDNSARRIKALVSNVQRMCSSSVVVIHRDARYTKGLEGIADKVLLDAPCSSESTVRKGVDVEISEEVIRKMSALQKSLVHAAHKILKDDGIMVYSTCTFAPEENEEVVDYAINLGFEVEKVSLPLRYENGVEEWNGKTYDSSVRNVARVYPHLDDTGGIVIARLRKVSD